MIKPTFNSDDSVAKNAVGLTSGYTEKTNFNDDLYNAKDDSISVVTAPGCEAVKG